MAPCRVVYAFCIYHFLHQFSFLEDVGDVPGYHWLRPAKQAAHLFLGKPHRLAICLHLETNATIIFINNYLLI